MACLVVKLRDLAILGTVVGGMLAGGSAHAATGHAQATLIDTAGAPGDTYTWSAGRPVWSTAVAFTSGGNNACVAAAFSKSNYATVLTGQCVNAVSLRSRMVASQFDLCTSTSPITSSGGVAASLAVCSVTDSFRRNGAPVATMTLMSWAEFHGTP